MPTPKELWDAQKREFPRSVQLFSREMLRWAEQYDDPARKLMRYRALAQCIQFQTVVFYRTDPDYGHLGARYGTAPHEYLSGFDLI